MSFCAWSVTGILDFVTSTLPPLSWPFTPSDRRRFVVATGTGAHAWFLLVQTALLTALGLLLGFPFQAQAMIAAIVYVSSRVSPMEKM
jgi:hypothetical protein